MPCTYFETREEIAAASKKERQQKQRDELDKVTRLLCWVMKHVRDFEMQEAKTVLPVNKELEDWYEAHKEKDKQRLEAIKAGAKKKLTKEEIKALGIN